MKKIFCFITSMFLIVIATNGCIEEKNSSNEIYNVRDISSNLQYYINKTVTVEGSFSESVEDVGKNYSVIFDINFTNLNYNRMVVNLSDVDISGFKYFNNYFNPNKVYRFTGLISIYYQENLQMTFPEMKVKTIVESDKKVQSI